MSEIVFVVVNDKDRRRNGRLRRADQRRHLPNVFPHNFGGPEFLGPSAYGSRKRRRMLAYCGVSCQATKKNTDKLGSCRHPAVTSPAGVDRSSRSFLNRIIQLIDGLFLGQNLLRTRLEHRLNLIPLAGNRQAEDGNVGVSGL